MKPDYFVAKTGFVAISFSAMPEFIRIMTVRYYFMLDLWLHCPSLD